MTKREEYSIPKEQASPSLRLALLLPFAKRIVGKDGCQGIRCVFLKFLAVESYTCFQEPELAPWPGKRLVFWKTRSPQKTPVGWKKWRGISMGRTSGIAHVHKDFLKDWRPNARRLAIRQKKEGVFSSPVSIEEFARAYHASRYLDFFLRYGFIRVVKDHLRVHSEDVSIRFFYNKERVFLGGAVFVDYPDIRQSHYLISFLTEAGKKVGAGYAFIYWWYQDLLAKDFRWADFGIVWEAGDPLSWQGYSWFKEKFAPEHVTKETFWKVT